MQDTFDKEQVLERLIHKTSANDWQPGTRNAAMLAKKRHVPESAANLYLKDLHQLALPMNSESASFTDQMSELVKQVWLRLEDYAHHAVM